MNWAGTANGEGIGLHFVDVLMIGISLAEMIRVGDSFSIDRAPYRNKHA
jgi:hypothetical protein